MRQFLKYTLASLTGSILFFLLLGSLLTIGAIGLAGLLVAGLSQGGDPTVERDSILVYDLATLVPDSPATVSPESVLISGAPIPQVALRRAVLALEAAATDDRIAGLYLKGSPASLGAGLANQQEIYQAIARFKESGKPVLAYDVSWSEREYSLASLADTVYLNPFGEIEMNGFYAETLYQAEALEKLGIGVQVTRVGRYKSAVEPFTSNTMSPEEREQTQRLLQDLWQELVTTTAQAREMQPQQLQAIADTEGLLFGDTAQTQGLADTLAYEDEVIAALRDITGQGAEPEGNDDPADSFRQIGLPQYAQVVEDDWVSRNSRNRIAVVYAEGPIVLDGSSNEDTTPTGVIAGNALARQLRRLRQDEAVKAVVLRVNSPGGSATASEIILREIQLIQEAGKPVVVSMGNVAASGGYWIAASADAIVAQPGTITGSIGVFGLFFNLQDLGDKVGVNWEGVKTAALADMFTGSRPRTPQELAIFQRAVDNIYDAFLDRVANGRDLPLNRVAELAQGRVWSGQTSQTLGLVDELGGLEQAILKAAELAELEDDWQLREYPELTGWQRFWESIFSSQTTAIPLEDPVTAQLRQVWEQQFDLLQTLNDPRGVYLLMPFELRVD